eukprot:g1265.t1
MASELADDALRADFGAASEAVKGVTGIKTAQMLSLYALFKQANCGALAEQVPRPARPSIFAQKALLKWDAWNKLGSMSQTEAMMAYVNTASSLCAFERPSTLMENAQQEVQEEEPNTASRQSAEEALNGEKLLLRDFEAAAKALKDVKGLGTSEMLSFYSLYKQGMHGPLLNQNPRPPRPGIWSQKALMKWDAWAKLGGMSQHEAMERYVIGVMNVSKWKREPATSNLDRPGTANKVVKSMLREEKGERRKELSEVETPRDGQPPEDTGSGDKLWVKEGMLLKQSDFWKKMNSRFFRVSKRKHLLYYYLAKTDETPRGIIQLSGCVVTRSRTRLRIANVKSSKSFILDAYTEENAKEWRKCLADAAALPTRASATALPTPTRSQQLSADASLAPQGTVQEVLGADAGEDGDMDEEVLKEKQRRPSAGTDSPSSLPKILLYAAVPLVIALVAVQYSGVLEPLLGMLK